jgi:hypothetical protein
LPCESESGGSLAWIYAKLASSSVSMLTARNGGCPLVAAHLWLRCGSAPGPLALRSHPVVDLSGGPGTPPRQLGQELIGRVLIPREQPALPQLAVAHMGHQHVSGVKSLPLALAPSRKQRHRVLVVGHDIVQL